MSTATAERASVRFPSMSASSEPQVPGYDATVAAEVAEGVTIYVARHPALPRCFAQGESPQEAQSNLDAVRDAFLRDMRAAGIEVPPPKLHPQTSYLSPESTPYRRHGFTWRVTLGDLEVIDF